MRWTWVSGNIFLIKIWIFWRKKSWGPFACKYGIHGSDFTAEFNVNGLEDSLLTTKTSEFTIEDKKTRIFPDIYYNPVVEFGASILSATSRLPSAGKKADSTPAALHQFCRLPIFIFFQRTYPMTENLTFLIFVRTCLKRRVAIIVTLLV